MLNFIKTHICTVNFFKFFFVFLLVITQCKFDPDSRKKLDKDKKFDPQGLNFIITNKLSEFVGGKIIEKEANKFLQQWNLAGMSMSIVKDGKLVYAQGFGYSEVESKMPVGPGQLFRVASVSKLITAVAIMKLVDSKAMKIDSKVFGPKAILKDTIFNHVADKRLYDITVRHLLAHAGGWSLQYGDPAFNSEVILERIGETGNPTMDSYFKFIASRKLHFTPGTRSSYSNMGYMFLQKVIEAVSGKSYEDFITNDVLKPQGISDMHIGRSFFADRRTNEVKYYESAESEMVPAYDGSGRMVPKQYGGNPIELLGSAGGWISSSVELAKLMVLIDGFRSVPDMLPRQLIKTMIEKEDFKGPLGWKIVKDNGDWIRTGSMAGTSAILKRQENGFCWVVLINSSSWKGPRLPAYIEYMMNKIEKSVKEWPKHDLFKYVPKEL